MKLINLTKHQRKTLDFQIKRRVQPMKLARWIMMVTWLGLHPFISLTHSDPLQAVIESEQYQELEKSIEKPDEKLSDWVNPKTPYGSLLLSSNSIELFSSWMGSPSEKFVEKKRTEKKRREYLELTFVYDTNESSGRMTIMAYVPLPKFGPMSSYGLVQGIAALEPPGLSILSVEDITINTLSGKLYHQLDDTCSILLKLPKFTRIQGIVSDCHHTKNLVMLMKELSFSNVAEKLSEVAVEEK